MIINEQIAALRDNKDYIMIGPRGVGRRAWKWEQGGNINVKLHYDRG